MRSVRYGSKQIEYSFQEKEGLKSHYISVEKHSGVVLKGKPVSETVADKLILKKAKWILDKLDVVKAVKEDDIVTGSRLPYLGKSYYVQVVIDKQKNNVAVEFNYSKFTITIKSYSVNQQKINEAVNEFYKQKAIEKISPRVKKLSDKTGLKYEGFQFRTMNKRWGSCTPANKIIINTNAIKLPFSLVDYLIVHELVHTKVKDHSKQFWNELAKHVKNWKQWDEKIAKLKL